MANDEYPGVIPMISYEDGVSALEWLARAFGFRERMRMLSPGGALAHGEMDTGGGVIMLATPTADYQGPRKHREQCAQARGWSEVPWVIDGVLVYVPNVDEHYATAHDAGAVIRSPPADDGHGRSYRAEDLEGHRWMFVQR